MSEPIIGRTTEAYFTGPSSSQIRARWKRKACRNNPHCAYCNSRVGIGLSFGWLEATVDHIIPLARGGKDREDNFALSCRACNAAKGSAKKYDPDARRKLIMGVVLKRREA